MSTRLAALPLSLGYDDRVVVGRLDLDVLDGRVTAIVGANACDSRPCTARARPAARPDRPARC